MPTNCANACANAAASAPGLKPPVESKYKNPSTLAPNTIGTQRATVTPSSIMLSDIFMPSALSSRTGFPAAAARSNVLLILVSTFLFLSCVAVASISYVAPSCPRSNMARPNPVPNNNEETAVKANVFSSFASCNFAATSNNTFKRWPAKLASSSCAIN